jgi:hypothetical protein
MTINALLETTRDRWHWLGLPPSYEASMRFPGSREQISQACQQAMRQSGFRVRRSDLAGGWVEARTRISIRSWSENVSIYLDDENQVHVSSECSWPTTVIDWGKNRWNVRRIFTNLTSILGDPC